MNNNICKVCGRDGDLRFGCCYDCVEAEAIIENGLDMYDRDIDGIDDGKASITPMGRLRFLLKKGWLPPK